MYVRGVESLVSNLNNESNILTDTDPVGTTGQDEPVDNKGKDTKTIEIGPSLQIPIPIMLTLYSVSSSKTIGEYSTAEKIIYIGCMKSGSGLEKDKKDAKKNGDFTFENIKDINLKGFNIDLPKVYVILINALFKNLRKNNKKCFF